MFENQIEYKGKVIFFDECMFWIEHKTPTETLQICFHELVDLKNYIDEEIIKNN